MTITDLELKRAKPKDRPYKLFDGKGLFIIITPTGGKWWRFRYILAGKHKTLSLGVYPAFSLAEAREKAREMKIQLQRGIDPSNARKATAAAKHKAVTGTFEVVAREWFIGYSSDKAISNTKRVMELFIRDIFPWLGGRLVCEIEPTEILSVVRRIVDRGAVETAHRALAKIGQVIRYAVGTGRATRDLTQDLRGILPPAKHEHFQAPINAAGVIDHHRVGEILRMIDSYRGGLIVKCAARLGPLVFVRPGELRSMKWSEIDFESKQWCFLVTKTKTPHIVPLSRQAIEILQEIKPLTGDGEYVFPGRGGRPMSDGAISAAYAAIGLKEEITGHSWRSVARTLLAEQLGFDAVHIEIQLAHKVFRGALGSAYDRTQYLPDRTRMMQRWADYLDDLRAGKTDLSAKTEE